MAQRVTKSVRMLPEEWEVCEEAALVAGVCVTTWLREVGLRVARQGLAALAESEVARADVGGAPAAREVEVVAAGGSAAVGGSLAGKSLLAVVHGRLAVRFGNRADLRALAEQQIRAGRWGVQGLAVRDPAFLVVEGVVVDRV